MIVSDAQLLALAEALLEALLARPGLEAELGHQGAIATARRVVRELAEPDREHKRKRGRR